MKKIIRFVLGRVPRPVIQRFAHIAMPIAGLFYAGRKVVCPICGRHYRKFMPYGYVVSRDNALCPGCLSLERHRLMWLYLKCETDIFSHPQRLLHIAPERCFIRRFEKMWGEGYITADLESPLAKVKMDIQAMPFGDSEFDVIFCNHILEHVEDDRLAMSEMLRVMKPGGWGIMMSPVTAGMARTYEDPSITTPHGRAAAFGQHDHVREYGEDYPNRLREVGFEVESLDYAASFTPEQQHRYGVRGEILYIATKQE